MRQKITGQESKSRVTVVAIALVALFMLAGCSVHEDKSQGAKKVDIQTPVGGMHVSEEADVRDTGLPVYPGAKPKPKEGSDESSANVNIATSFFGLKVVALKYTVDAPPDKVTDFYKKELTHFGTVQECHSKSKPGDTTIVMGTNKGNVNLCEHEDREGDTLELRVGTKNNQHVVAIKPSGNGTDFSLVYVQAHGQKDEAL